MSLKYSCGGTPSLVVNSAEAESLSRITAIRLVSMTLRLMEEWRGLIEDQDCVMIMMAVAVINTESLNRAQLIEEGIADLKHAAPPSLLRKCNISSVALATGLNRETTRRKITQLVDLGLLARSCDGHVYLDPKLGIRPQLVETIRSQLDTFAKIANELLRDGILRLRTG